MQITLTFSNTLEAAGGSSGTMVSQLRDALAALLGSLSPQSATAEFGPATATEDTGVLIQPMDPAEMVERNASPAAPAKRRGRPRSVAAPALPPETPVAAPALPIEAPAATPPVADPFALAPAAPAPVVAAPPVVIGSPMGSTQATAHDVRKAYSAVVSKDYPKGTPGGETRAYAVLSQFGVTHHDITKGARSELYNAIVTSLIAAQRA